MEDMKWKKKKMIEEAEEELERLESEHPHNFHVLKMDLKSLISHLFHHSSISLSNLLLHNPNHDADTDSDGPSASTATTQESSCRKRKRVVVLRKQIPSAITEAHKNPPCCNNKGEYWETNNKRRLSDDTRVEAVVHRAQLCLHKLHAFKTTLLF